MKFALEKDDIKVGFINSQVNTHICAYMYNLTVKMLVLPMDREGKFF